MGGCTGTSAKLLIAIYTYWDSRSKVTAEELLGSYDGIVQTDGLGAYGSEEQLDSIMPWSAALPETCHRTYHQIIENEAEVK